MISKKKLPISIITGFLGSGKTTVLNYLLKQPELKSTAVIVNEFGEIGIDHLLVETSTEQMVEINNGCICCTIRGDLADKLGSLAMYLDLGRIPPVDRVIVETTGLADPAPIMHTLMTDPDLLDRYELSRVVTLVDSITGLTSLDKYYEAVKQVAMADHLVLSKLDLIETLSNHDAYDILRKRISDINSRALVHEANQGKIPIDILMPSGSNGKIESLGNFSEWLRVAEADTNNAGTKIHHHDHGDNESNAGVRTFLVRIKEKINSDKFNEFLQKLAIDYGQYILRMKGILYTEENPCQPAVIHGVQHVFFPVTWLDKWPDEDYMTKLVFITHELEPAVIQEIFRENFSGVVTN